MGAAQISRERGQAPIGVVTRPVPLNQGFDRKVWVLLPRSDSRQPLAFFGNHVLIRDTGC